MTRRAFKTIRYMEKKAKQKQRREFKRNLGLTRRMIDKGRNGDM